jgi:hypothetical protein
MYALTVAPNFEDSYHETKPPVGEFELTTDDESLEGEEMEISDGLKIFKPQSGSEGLENEKALPRRRTVSIALELPGEPCTPRSLPATSPVFLNRAASPMSPSYVRYFPVNFEPQMPGTAMDPTSPIQVFRKTLSASPRFISKEFRAGSPSSDPKSRLGRLLRIAEEAITPQFIDRVLTVQIFTTFDTDIKESLKSLNGVSSEIDRMREAFTGLQIDDISETFRASEKLRVLSRLVSEMLVDISNSKDVERALQNANPFIKSYIAFASSVGLESDFLSLYRELISPPRPLRFSSDSDTPQSLFNRIERAMREEIHELNEFDAMFGDIKVFLANPGDKLQTFCSRYASDILILLVNGVPDFAQATYSVTRLGIKLVQVCMQFISVELRFFQAFPRILQSGIDSVPGFLDGDIVLTTVQGKELMPTVLKSLRTFSKLELMNDVQVEFESSSAVGIDGLRREWISQSLAAMTDVVTGGLFEYADGDQKTLLRPLPDGDVEQLRTFGRILGFALRYGISPGLSLARSCIRFIIDQEIPSESEIDLFLAQQDPLKLSILNSLLFMDADVIATLSLDIRPMETVEQYVLRQKIFTVYESTREAMQHILAGLSDTIRLIIFQSLTVDELEHLLRGESEINVDELMEHTSWSARRGARGRMSSDHTPGLVYWLFDILSTVSEDEKRQFLSFVSGSPRRPIGGYVSEGDPDREWLHIYVDHIMSLDSLPRAQTCYVSLRLPAYGSKELLREKLLKAISFTTTIELA